MEATAEFDMPPVPAKPRTVALVNIYNTLVVLMNDGSMYERVADNSRFGPGGPFWAWRPVKGPLD